MPVCAPRASVASPVSAFTFSDATSEARAYENALALWSAPWRAWWALTFEALDASNWRGSR